LNTVYDYPLALCDFSSLDVNDMIPTELNSPPPIPVVEIYTVKYNSKQMWWYWSEMTPDDIFIIMNYDSASRAMKSVSEGVDIDESELLDVAGVGPHSAFKNEQGIKQGISRNSIEVRAVLFYD